jgi:hypothetical protein
MEKHPEGLSEQELAAEGGQALPDREAMSTITPADRSRRVGAAQVFRPLHWPPVLVAATPEATPSETATATPAG